MVSSPPCPPCRLPLCCAGVPAWCLAGVFDCGTCDCEGEGWRHRHGQPGWPESATDTNSRPGQVRGKHGVRTRWGGGGCGGRGCPAAGNIEGAVGLSLAAAEEAACNLAFVQGGCRGVAMDGGARQGHMQQDGLVPWERSRLLAARQDAFWMAFGGQVWKPQMPRAVSGEGGHAQWTRG